MQKWPSCKSMHLSRSLRAYSSQQYWNTSFSQPTLFLLIHIFFFFFFPEEKLCCANIQQCFILILSWHSGYHIQRFCVSCQNMLFTFIPFLPLPKYFYSTQIFFIIYHYGLQKEYVLHIEPQTAKTGLTSSSLKMPFREKESHKHYWHSKYNLKY